MIYVVDASAIVDLLIRSDPGESVRRRLSTDTDAVLVTVAHLDAEVFSGLARLNRAGELTVAEVEQLLRRLARLDVRRLPINGELLEAAWRLRDNISARGALYAAAARGLGGSLMTTDDRLARAVPDLAADLT